MATRWSWLGHDASDSLVERPIWSDMRLLTTDEDDVSHTNTKSTSNKFGVGLAHRSRVSTSSRSSMSLNASDCVVPALNTLTSACYGACNGTCLVYSQQGGSAGCSNHPAGLCHANVGANNCVVLCFKQESSQWTYRVGVPDPNYANIGKIERLYALDLPKSVTSLSLELRDHVDTPTNTVELTSDSIGKADGLKTLAVEQLLVPNISALSVFTNITSLELRKVKATVDHLNDMIAHTGAIENLDLSGNKLQTIPSNIFGMTALQSLNMTDNELVNLVLDKSQVAFLQQLKSFQGSSTRTNVCSDTYSLAAWQNLQYCYANKTTENTAQPTMIEANTIAPKTSATSKGSATSLSTYLLYIGLGGLAIIGLIFYFVIFRKKSQSKGRKRKETIQEHPDEASDVNPMAAMDNNGMAFQACQSTRSSEPSSLAKSNSSRSSLTTSMPIRSLHHEILAKDIDVSPTSVVFRHNHFDMLVGRMRHGKVYVNRLLPMTHDKALSLLSILSTLRHPRIMNVVGVIWRSVDENPLGGIQMDVCLEYLDSGTLEYVLTSRKNQLTWNNGKMQMALEIAHALMQIHDHDFIYNGLTGKTVFVDSNQGCKLHTLALVDEAEIDENQLNTEDRLFLAPEALVGCAISSATDMYAFGVLLMLLDAASTPRELSRRTWMQTMNDPDADSTMPDEVDITSLIGLYAFDESQCPAIIKAVAKSCLHPDPYQRPSASFAYAMMHKDFVDVMQQVGPWRKALCKNVARMSTGVRLAPRGGAGSGAKIAGRSRFYKEVAVEGQNEENGGGYCVTLDGKKVRTPARALLQLPTKSLASAVAMEWDAQKETIQPSTMPMMSLAATSLDFWNLDIIIEELMKYLQTDTICFPVEKTHQEKLAARQEKKWGALRKWFEAEFDGELDVNHGTITVLQHNPTAVENVRSFLQQMDNFELMAFRCIVRELKSMTVALALVKRHITAKEAIELGRLEEEFQIERWGLVEGGHDLDRVNFHFYIGIVRDIRGFSFENRIILKTSHFWRQDGRDMDNNAFLQMDDMMDAEELGLLENSYNPFITNMSNMSLANPMGMMQQMRSMPPRPVMASSPAHIDVDMMNSSNPSQSNNNSTLFQAYASQFGMKQHVPQHENPAGDTNSVEAYAALMGVKLESPRSMQPKQQTFAADPRVQSNAQYFESLLKMQGGGAAMNNGHNLTSMTLPAGVGSGFHHQPPHNAANNNIPMDNRNLVAMCVDPSNNNPPMPQIKTEKPMPVQFNTGVVGSQTLSPEMLSSMIQNNIQNSDMATHSYGSNTWNASDFDYEKDALISKADKSRERNRDHSRKSRLRKKAFVECLKQEVKQLQIYKDMVDQNPDLIALVTTDNDRKIMFLTSAFNRILGHQDKQLMSDNTSFFELVHPDCVATIKAELSKLAKYQDINGVCFQIKHAKGMYWKAQLSARMGEQGVVITTRVEKANLPASIDQTS
ncbi:hypothetical protein THRCLA_04219 [Thraustotheca clavata]|uniref:Protein kinase domain-containing protein n=1 Tax=Thraustotheca clavata TaxID=74557 RepID=A0A1V9ZZT7_9STRA|nr:hypothetical protein THRCLA_04219 [Thraustotheca clavata]